VPIAVVIPAPIGLAYIYVIAVKNLIVGSRGRAGGPPSFWGVHRPPRP